MFLRYILKKLNFKSTYYKLEKTEWNLSKQKTIYDKYFKNKIINSDAIVIVGGGLIKYKYQKFYLYIDYITKYADKYNKPVFFNSVGVEGYDLSNPKCKLLQKALNRDCVKSITTRDDYEKLSQYIYNKDIVIDKVSDPALYTSAVFNICKLESDIVGLCLCRKNLFKDNDVNIDANYLFNLWKQIIDELDKKNINWYLYTNGVSADNEFAEDFIELYNIPTSKLLIPAEPVELVKIISKFRCVVATRLHSCIISCSLNIPAIGLVWNDKLKLFGESINYSERFLLNNDINKDKIIQLIDKIWNETYEKMDKKYIEKIIKSIDNVIKIMEEKNEK